MINAGVYQNNFGSYAIKRVLITVITFIIISLIVFFSFRLLLTEKQILFGTDTIDPLFFASTEAEYQEKYAEFETGYNKLLKERGLDGPLTIQYFRWIGRIFTGDWGESIMPASYYTE